MSVVGFDLGNETCVIAAARQRGIDVLLNAESSRENPAVVSFGEKQRSLGAAGAASATMNPKSTVSQVKRLLGRAFRDPTLQDELHLLPFPVSEAPDGGVLVRVRYLNEERAFTPVQILAMLLSHLKQIAETALEAPVFDCVIGIPSYATDLQRRAYLDAAAIAGLRPLRLMHDAAATALGYGIYRTEPQHLSAAAGAGRAAHVVFVDVGHCDTQVAVAEFQRGQMRILSHAFDAHLGGRDFDEVLFRYFSERFKEQYNIDVDSNLRASIRLRSACEKLKKVLSANAEAPINIECLMDEKDVKGFIKREDFERLSSELLERILVPCKKALVDAKLGVDRIQSVELVGSGSRIPAVSRMLKGLFKREPSRTLNVSECVARGCALQCAMLSPTFRVRDYEVQDSFPFSVGFSSDEGPICTSSSSIIFPRGQHIPSVKMLTFQRTNTFHLEAFYADQSELPPGVSEKIGHFTIGPFQVSHNEKPKVKVRIHLNLHGIVTVESASLIEDNLKDPVPRAATPSNIDNMEPEFDSVAPDAEATAVENGFSQPEARHLPPVRSTEDQSSEADGIVKGWPSRRLEIPVTETVYGGMTKMELSEAQAQELQLACHDRMVERTKDQKNALEAYVYEIRNKLLEKYRSFANESEREEISRHLQETEEWLYDDGDDECENVYTKKLEELEKLVGPIENRFKEEEARAHEVRELLNCIVDYRMAAQSFPAPDRDVALQVIEECNKAEQWLREKTQLQESLPRNTDPILWSNDIKNQTESLQMSCQQIMESKHSQSRSDDSGGSKPN
uniref:Heat shock protein 16 n=1 Tax=Anthurium amnicola TaxID=1678845 RepID=A0A1D1ZIY1_9ARAE